jgi:hypothetical protein
MGVRERGDATGELVTWKTGVGAILLATVLTAGAVAGVLLGARGGGLARAEVVLSMIPADVSLVGVAEPAGFAPLAPLAAWPLPLEGAERVYFFARAAEDPVVIAEGGAGGAGGSPAGEHQGAQLYRLGPSLVAPLGGGRVVAGPDAVVREVLDRARGAGRGLPATPDYRALRALAERGRDETDLQVVLFPARDTEAVRAWPALAGVAACAVFRRIVPGAGAQRVVAQGTPEALARLEADLGKRGAFSVERVAGLLVATRKGPPGPAAPEDTPAPRLFFGVGPRPLSPRE